MRMRCVQDRMDGWMGHRSRLRLHSVEGIPNGGVLVGNQKRGGGLDGWTAILFRLMFFLYPRFASC